MLVMAVLLMAGTTFLTISSTESQIALNEQVSTQASLLAEAALHKAIAQLNANSAYTGETNTALGGGTFTVTVTTAAGCTPTPPSARNLVVTATVPIRGGQAQVQLQATVDQIWYPYRWGVFAAGDYLILSALSGKSKTDSFDSSRGSYGASKSSEGGNIGSNGYVVLYNAQVNGNARQAASSPISSWYSTVSGVKATGVPSEPFPSVTPSPPSPPGALNWTSGTLTLAAGTYYYTSMKFDKNTSLKTSGGPVTIYVTGNVDLGDKVTFGSGGTPPTDLTIITKSDEGDPANFTAGKQFELYGSLYGRNTNITLGDQAEIYGAIIGRRITGSLGGYWNWQGPEIHYDQAMADKEICHSGNYSIRRGTWREVIP